MQEDGAKPPLHKWEALRFPRRSWCDFFRQVVRSKIPLAEALWLFFGVTWRDKLREVVGVAQLVERRSVACKVGQSNTLNRHCLQIHFKFLDYPLSLTLSFLSCFPVRYLANRRISLVRSLKRLDHPNHAILKRVIDVRKVPSFNSHFSELLVYAE